LRGILNTMLKYGYKIKKVITMSGKFIIGQRVRVVGVDDIPYGQKYSYLAATLDKTGVIQEITTQSNRYVVRMDEDGELASLSESCLQEVGE